MVVNNVIGKVSLLAFLLLIGLTDITRAQLISTFSGIGTAGFSGDGALANLAQINFPKGICFKDAGNIYFSDQVNFRIRHINPDGIITTCAGNGSPGFFGDGGPATLAKINGVKGIAIDALGNIYLADQSNNRIRKIDTAGIISTFAGNGSAGFSGDGTLATGASLNHPQSVTVDGIGNVYISDGPNCRVRKVNTSGIITTYAGNGIIGYSGDGGLATAAKLANTYDVVVDGLGNLFISDADNKRIRKVNATGIISTVAGIGTTGFSGDGSPATLAQLNNPYGLAIDNLGNLYIADVGNNRIRKVDISGYITTVAGTGIAGYSGDGVPATAAQLNGPGYLAVDCAGDLFISDNINQRIRKVNYDFAPYFSGGVMQNITICENSSPASIDTLLSIVDSNTGQTETWNSVRSPLHGILSATYSASSSGTSVLPTGLYYVPNTGFLGNDTFSVKITDCANESDTIIVIVRVVDCALRSNGLTWRNDGLSVQPNPAIGGVFTLNLFSSSTVPVSISITNLVGKQIQEIKSETNKETEIHLDVNPGIYFLNAITSNGNYTAKIVVK